MKKKKDLESTEEIEALLEKCHQAEAKWIEYKDKMAELEKELDEDFEKIENSLNEIREEIKEIRKDA